MDRLVLGVLIANAGHARKEIVDAISAQAASHLLTNYCFPSEIRARLVERLSGLLPEPLKKVFLLTTGSEAVEVRHQALPRARHPQRRPLQERDRLL